MKNAYDTFATWNDGAMAAGFDGDRPPRQTVTARRPESRTRSAGGNKVIDLNAWRAANLAMLEKEALDEAEWAGAGGSRLPAPQEPPGHGHRRAGLHPQRGGGGGGAGCSGADVLTCQKRRTEVISPPFLRLGQFAGRFPPDSN